MRLAVCSEHCYDRNLAARLRRAGVPKLYLNCGLQSFDAYVPSLQRKLEVLKRWVASDPRKGLYLFGSVGAGKTHLAVAVMKELFRRGVRGLYTDCLTFILRCQTAFAHGESVEEMVNDLLKGRLLVLDDLGTQKLTDYVRQSVFHLVNCAYTRGKVLVVTSNLALEQLDDSNPRLASRLAQMCELIQFGEVDYRIVLAEQRVDPKEAEAEQAS
jgi:DNA replication protein DnaC